MHGDDGDEMMSSNARGNRRMSCWWSACNDGRSHIATWS